VDDGVCDLGAWGKGREDVPLISARTVQLSLQVSSPSARPESQLMNMNM
jgi:hypothetical protein